MTTKLTKIELGKAAEKNNWAALLYNEAGQLVSHTSDPEAESGWIVRDEDAVRADLDAE